MFKTLSAKAATQLDQELMSTGGFSIDQLMELAGLAVAQAIYTEYPPSSDKDKIVVLVGPGNNGGDGLVAARHLKLWDGYDPVVYYPKKTNKPLYTNLMTQLKDLDVKEVSDLQEVKNLMKSGNVKLIIDAIFGFSFHPPVRSPFDEVINFLSEKNNEVPPIVSVDIPSGWDVNDGPISGSLNINPTMLVSLTAPKPASRFFNKPGLTHYLGGRFINPHVAKKYDIQQLIEKYKGNEIIVKL